jgi:Heliorhodopsin
MSALATIAPTTTQAQADRSSGLFHWNLVLAGLHLFQFAAMLVLSLARDPLVTAPVTSAYLAYDPSTRTLSDASRPLFELPIGPAVAAFLLLSAIAHLTMALPARRWYEARLARGQNPIRWIEYAFSSSLMIIVIASLSGVREIGTLIAIFGANAGMILFGWSMEAANEGRARPQWLHFVFGSVTGVVPWIVIGVALGTAATAPGAVGIPGFVIAIYISMFITFNIFALNMVLQNARVGPWRDYGYGERAYMILSLVAKTLLAWQVWAGTLRP